MMRIITGSARGIKLLTLEGTETRPTAERTKEAVFSMLQFDIEGRRVLDMFAGSGQMALEALSRGASSAVILDKSKGAIDIIRKNAEKTRLVDKCNIFCADFKDYLIRNKGDKFDIVFIDPPYDSDLVKKSLLLLVEVDALKPTTIIVCESNAGNRAEDDKDVLELYDIVKSGKYGIAHVNILTPKGEH